MPAAPYVVVGLAPEPVLPSPKSHSYFQIPLSSVELAPENPTVHTPLCAYDSSAVAVPVMTAWGMAPLVKVIVVQFVPRSPEASTTTRPTVQGPRPFHVCETCTPLVTTVPSPKSQM